MVIYTDGSCTSNGGPNSRGGFGVVVADNSGAVLRTYSKQCENTTNNREELKAILWAMWNYGNDIFPPTVYSDSAYCVNSLTSWIWGWERNGWVKSDGKELQNRDIMETFVRLWRAGYQINLVKVKGHAGNPLNELADKLATGKVKGE